MAQGRGLWQRDGARRGRGTGLVVAEGRDLSWQRDGTCRGRGTGLVRAVSAGLNIV